ncbi:MAG: hypothetical protein WBH49_04545 [Flavobacteriaceae bacterium]|jgi:hypothetical protein
MSTNPNLTYTKDGSLDMRSKKNKEWLANQNKKNEQPNIIKHAPPIHIFNHTTPSVSTRQQKPRPKTPSKLQPLPGGKMVYFMR